MSPLNASEDGFFEQITLPSRVLICTGKKCKKRPRQTDKLQRQLPRHCDTTTVKCQKMCKGPVVVVKQAGVRYWFSNLKGKKNRRAFAEFLVSGRISPRLERRLQKRR
jgi:(2Fe-2S) ferredoxin